METDYWNSLDRESDLRAVHPKMLGISTSINKSALEQLKARIFEGASTVELGFMGKEKGSLGQGGTTPEMHSREQREDIRQLAKINEVGLSTHATIALGSVSGMTQHGFRDEEREKAIHEIKRTVDFAADTAGGGPIVVHTGEFSRPIYEAEKGKFRAFEGEEEQAPVFFVDKRTGDLKGIERNKPISIAVKDKEGNYERDKEGKLQIESKTYAQMEEEFKKLSEKEKQKFDNHAEKYFYNKIKEEEVGRYKVESEHYDLQVRVIKKNIEGLKQLQQNLEQNKDREITKQIIDEYRKKSPDLAGASDKVIEDRIKNPEPQIQQIQNEINSLQADRGRFEEGAVNYARSAETAKAEVENIIPVREFGVGKSADSLAKAAIYAYDKEKAMKLEKPLFIAPENIFPEQYGAHPQELKTLVLEARKKMVEKLTKEPGRGVTKSEAQKIADEHIKATFDVGHANTWKKFFTGKEEDFKKWMKDQVEDLQKSGIIGHVHLSDNFGYYDEHLAPGEGNVPIKELANMLDKHGYKGKFIVEWGAQTPETSHRVLTSAWGSLSSPTYKIDSTGMAWTDVQGSYFGRTSGPTYVVGDYAPSKDWTLWSETQLE